MLTKWKLFNFKSVQKETELALAPLTIFAGPNSSGKSTWIQSILLISQTIASKVPSPSAVVLNGQLAKLGQFDDLRSYESESNQILIGWECKPMKAETSILLDDLEPTSVRALSDIPEQISGEVYFDANPTGSDSELKQLQPRLFNYNMSCIAKDDIDISSISRLSITLSKNSLAQKIEELQVPQTEIHLIRNDLERDVELDETSLKLLESRELDDESVKLVGCTFKHHFLPNSLLIRYNQAEEESRMISSVLIDEGLRPSMGFFVNRSSRRNLEIPSKAVNLLKDWLGEPLSPLFQVLATKTSLDFSGNDFTLSLGDWLESLRNLPQPQRADVRRKIRKEITPEKLEELNEAIYEAIIQNQDTPYTIKRQQLPKNLRSSIRYVDSYFSSSVKYLGPLRDEPKPLYPLAPTIDPSDVGLRGEYTAAVFDRYKDEQIIYVPTSCFPNPKDGQSLGKEKLNRTLKTAVLDWLKYLEIAEDLETKDMGKLGHELKVTLPGLGKAQDLMHVGVGVSQVLPILVMCLLAEKDTTLIFEQPELHLHPFVQTRLADFFLSMARLGKQCIIETHSEYLINRLRFRVASDANPHPGDTLAEQIKIYFAEKVDGASHYREVTVNRYGAIVDWPKGFFDQSQREAEEILRASMAKRKQERQQKQEKQRENTDG